MIALIDYRMIALIDYRMIALPQMYLTNTLQGLDDDTTRMIPLIVPW